MGAGVGSWTELGIRRRCRALASAGWNPVAVSKASGIPVWVLDRLMQDPNPEDTTERLWVSWGWWRFCAAYERLSALPVLEDAPLDYPPPMAWDDIDAPSVRDDLESCGFDDRVDVELGPVNHVPGMYWIGGGIMDDLEELALYATIPAVADAIWVPEFRLARWISQGRVQSRYVKPIRELLSQWHDDVEAYLNMGPGVPLDRRLFQEHVLRSLPYKAMREARVQNLRYPKYLKNQPEICLPGKNELRVGKMLNAIGHPYRAQVNDTRKWYEQ